MSLANEFLLIADKFLESDASVVQLSNSFNNYVDEAKLRSGLLTNEDKAVDTEILLNCILQYLHCIIEYAGGGSAQARSASVRQLCNKICTTVEELKVKHEFVKNLSLSTFEYLFGQPSWIAKEVLRMYGNTIHSSDRAVRFEALQEKGPYYLGRLMDAIAFGDYEFQVMIVETLYRICTKEILNDMPKVYFLTPEQTEAFYKIITDEFDLTVRNFLNLLNEKDKHVVSLLCNKVTFDDIQLQEPPELKSFKGMWVDFNVKAGTVTLFLDNEPFNPVIKWEMITLFPENISKAETSSAFNEDKGRKEGIAKFVLKGPCMLCYTSSQNKLLNCRLLTLHSLDTERFREVFYQAFPKIHKKPKQANTLSYKRAYKPLDVISVKSSATNPSTNFNMTIDSILAGKKHKSRSGGTKSVTFADSTIHTNSSKSRSLSSIKSINISLNQSIQEEPDSLFLVDHKTKKSGDHKLKRNAQFDEMSAVSNLSVDKLIEARKNADKGFGSKKIKLSGLEELDHLSSHEHGTSKIAPHSKYNYEFLSSLMELGEDIDVLSEYNKNIGKGLDSKKKSKFMQKEADSTTLVGGLYSNKMILQNESITSDVFHSIEDIDNNDTKEIVEVKYGKTPYKKDLISKSLKTKQANTISYNIESSLEGNLSGLSADEVLHLKKNEQKKKVARKELNSKKKFDRNIFKGNNRTRENTDRVSSLGSELSPDLFIIETPESENENLHPNEGDEFSKHTRSENRRNVSTKSCTLMEMQDSVWVDPVRDCQLDEFDQLKLERPKVDLSENPKNENLPEPDLIQISQPNFQLPFPTETEMFETAKTNLDDAEVAEVQWSGKNLDLFQDISQENHYLKSSSQEESPEIDLNFNEEYKLKIQGLSNIQIQSSVSKSQMSASQKSQIRNIVTQKENISPAEEIEMSVGVSQTSDRNLSSQVVIGSSEIKQSAKYNSHANTSEANIAKVLEKSRGIFVTNKKIENLITDEKHKVEAARKTYSETQITVCPERRVLMEQTIDCNATSEEPQYSETQKTDSDHSEAIISQKDDRVEGAMNCGEQLPKFQKNNSQSIPSFEEKKLHQKMNEPKSNTGQEGKKKVLIINDIIINECNQNYSFHEKSKETKIENLCTDHNRKVKAVKKTYSETRITVLPEESVLMGQTIDCDATSQEQQYSETQKTDSQITPPKYEVVTSQPPHEEDQMKCEEIFPTEPLLDIQKDESQCTLTSKKTELIISQKDDCVEDTMDCVFSKLQKQYSFEEKKLQQEKKEMKCNTGQEGKKKEKKIQNLFADQTHQVKAVKNSDSDSQMTAPFEKRVLMEQIIDLNATSEELQYSETQKTDSHTMPTKYDDIQSQLSHEEDSMKCEEIFPTEQLLDSQKDESKCTSLPKKTEVIISHIEDCVEGPKNCGVQLPKLQKSYSQSIPSFEEKKIHQKKGELKSNTGQKGKKKVLIINDIIIKDRIQSDSCYEKSKEKKKKKTRVGKDRVNQSLKLSDNNIVEKLGCEKEVSETKTRKKKSKIPIKPSRATAKIKINNDNLIPFVKLSTMAVSVEKKHLSNIIEEDEDDIPLSELKQRLKSKIVNEIIRSQDGVEVQLQITQPLQIEVNENSVQFSKLPESSLPQYEDDVDRKNVEIEINKGGEGEDQTQLKSQTKIDGAKEGNIHDRIATNEEECGKFVDRVVIEEKKNDTLQRTVYEVDNEPNFVGKSSFKNTTSQEIKDLKQANYDIPHQSDQQNFKEAIEVHCSPAKQGNEFFQKYPEPPSHKKVILPKQMTVPGHNDKMENPEGNEVDEVHKSLQLLFGDEVNEPVTKNIDSAPPKPLLKIDKYINLSADTTNSIIAGSVGMLKRGRKLFNPENHEENFLNFTLIEEAIEKGDDKEKPNELLSASEYNKKKQPKKMNPSKFDKEIHKESKKIVESEGEKQRKKQEKNKFKRYSDMQDQQYRLSKFDFVNNSRKRRLDAIYDIVVERLQTQNGSARKSHSVAPKVKKYTHDTRGKYDLDFSTMKESLLEKDQYESKFKPSSNRFIESNKGDGDRSKERHIMESQQDDTDETMRVILRGLGTLCQKIAQGTLKEPSPSIQKNLFAAADLLLDL